MRPEINTEKLIKTFDIDVNAQTDKAILDEVLQAQAKTKEAKVNSPQPYIWRTIMKSRTTKFAAAAMIIAAVLIGIHELGGSIDGASVAWAELVERVEQSHDEYMRELLSATKEKDTEKINFYADLLDEFWQKLGWLAKAELALESQAQISAIIAREKANYDELEESDQIGIRIFLAYADQFSDWLGEIEDVTWINETMFVCKQMEEYAEEIRDGAESSELGLSYIEHCMPSFLEYSGWFEQLPWDNPNQYMRPSMLLMGIERDLEIAHRELVHLEIRGAGRFVRRCMDQARKNALEVGKKIESSRIQSQRKLCKQLARKIDGLSDLITYATIASWDLQQTNQTQQDEAFAQILTKEFANRGPFADYLLEQIDQSLDMCRQLLAELESEQ
jgi:hypothetical protein